MNDAQKEYEEKIKLQNQIAKIESIAKGYMTQDAVSRYGTLKSAHPDKAIQVASIITHLASQNEIRDKITDEQLKNLLITIEPTKRETKIVRK